MTTETTPKELSSFHELARQAAQARYFADTGLSLSLAQDHEDSPLHLVLGDNGSGKSFLVKLLAAYARRERMTALQVSMAYRTRSGMERAMMYGSEDDQSTGLTSIGVVRRAIRSMHGWDGKPHVALFDEPDTGLSDRYAHPMGRYLAQFALKPAAGTRGVLVITHSRALVQGLLAELQAHNRRPSVMLVGDRYASLEDFLAPPKFASIEEMLDIDAQAIQVWRTIERCIDENKAAKKQA